MTKGTKFVKISNFHTLFGPVSCSKKQGAGTGLVFQEKANNVRVVAVFIHPEHQIHPPSCLQSKISLVRSTLRIKSQRMALQDVSGEVLIDQTSSWQ